MKTQDLLPTRDFLIQADEMMKNGQFEKALEIVRKVYDVNPRNMYARAYEERIFMAMAEIKAKEESERLLSARMRDFIANQERPVRAQRPLQTVSQIQDPVVAEIEASLNTAREELYELIISKSANPAETAAKSKELVTTLTTKLKQRLEKIRKLMQDHERELVSTVKQEQESKTRKLYRSLVYMMHKLGVRFEHRGKLQYLVSHYAGFTPEVEAELRHNAELGIYEDLLKQAYVGGQEPTAEHTTMLKQVRTNFGITDAEHESLVLQVKNELMMIELSPTIAIIDRDKELCENIAAWVRSEFPKIDPLLFSTPKEFNERRFEILPNLILSGTLFGGDGYEGIEFLHSLKQHSSVIERATDLVLMVPSNDPFFDDAVRELGLSNMLKKPFSRELMLWTLRPFLFKASGAPIHGVS